MSENFGGGANLEQEIAELSRQIEEKKRALESASGIEHESREAVGEAIAERFYPVPAAAATGSASAAVPAKTEPQKVAADYLDSLTPEQIETINTYISMIPQAGIRTTVNRVLAENPFIIDAFHDALVTRLYDELKDRGIIK
jgi:hypothetical protein